ncbi:hypothetical protein MHBO_000968 [Bonamia ostreae]|uniref:Uncharacterized protein n=1 Tax=Bonamia ostreae TaxID=126728 RepID=A0ABV2AIM5_9EUKA
MAEFKSSLFNFRHFDEFSRFRISARITKEKNFQDFRFGESSQNRIESCVYLEGRISKSKSEAEKEQIRFYRDAEKCSREESHHPALWDYHIRETSTDKCVACEYFWPSTLKNNFVINKIDEETPILSFNGNSEMFAIKGKDKTMLFDILEGSIDFLA